MPALFVQPLGETGDTAVLTVLEGLESIHKTKSPLRCLLLTRQELVSSVDYIMEFMSWELSYKCIHNLW